jgi:hypothetical protein
MAASIRTANNNNLFIRVWWIDVQFQAVKIQQKLDIINISHYRISIDEAIPIYLSVIAAKVAFISL